MDHAYVFALMGDQCIQNLNVSTSETSVLTRRRYIPSSRSGPARYDLIATFKFILSPLLYQRRARRSTMCAMHCLPTCCLLALVEGNGAQPLPATYRYPPRSPFRMEEFWLGEESTDRQVRFCRVYIFAGCIGFHLSQAYQCRLKQHRALFTPKHHSYFYVHSSVHTRKQAGCL